MKTISFCLLASLLSLFACNDLEDPTTPGYLVPRTVDQDPSLPSLHINGTLLHLETFGNPTDPILIMIHGGPGGDYRSLLNARDFAEDGYFVVFYDQRGTGLSKREVKEQFDNDQIMINDLDALIDHFRLSADQKVFLFGHSWGAILATGYINQHPEKIAGVVLAEPGGLTWDEITKYLDRIHKVDVWSEELNDAIFPEQIFAGRDEDEILDYKAAFLSIHENAPGNILGNAGPYPFWRSGVVSAKALIDAGERDGLDYTTHLDQYHTKVLFAYSSLNRAYGYPWAVEVGSNYPNVEYHEITGTGHEMLFFGWNAFYPIALTYLNELK